MGGLFSQPDVPTYEPEPIPEYTPPAITPPPEPPAPVEDTTAEDLEKEKRALVARKMGRSPTILTGYLAEADTKTPKLKSKLGE